MARRLASWALGAVALLFLGWLAIANLLLMTSLGPSAVSSEHVRMTWERGWSFLPTRVHLRGLQVVVRDDRTSWRIEAREADATLGPLALLGGRVHARSARLDHVGISAEEGIAPPPPAEAHETAAPIVLVRHRNEADAPSPALALDRLEASNIHSVNVGPLGFIGSAAVRARLRISSSGNVELDDASVDTFGGDARWHGVGSLSDVRGHLTMTSGGVERSGASTSPWSFAGRDGGLELEAVIRGAGSDGAPDSVVPPGTVRARLAVVNGALAAGSTAAVRIPSGDAPSTFEVDGVLTVAEDARARLSVAARNVGWPLGEREPHVVGDDVELTLTSPRMMLDAPLANGELVLDVARGHADPARLPVLREFIGEDAKRLEGRAHLVFADGEGSGTVHAHSDALPLTVRQTRLQGSFDVDARIRSLRPGADELRLDIDAAHGSGAALSVRDGRASLGARPAFVGRTTIHFGGAATLLEAMTGRVDLPSPILAVASTQPFDATADLRADEDRWQLEQVAGSIGFVTVHGYWAADYGHPSTTKAALLLEAGPLATGVEVEGATTTFVLADARAWFDRVRK